MSSKYPSVVRARKAFEHGYYGTTGHNPYKHPKLRELWERGKKKAAERILSGLGPPVRPKALRRNVGNQRSQRSERFRSHGRPGGGGGGGGGRFGSSDSGFRPRRPQR